MKIFHPCLLIILMVTLITTGFPANAISEDNTCNLKSNTATLQVSVYNVLPAGTIGLRIWKGIVKQDEKVSLNSRYGRIYYEYNTNPEVYSSNIMGFIRPCRDKETFSLP